MTTMDDFGAFAHLAPLLVLRDRLRAAGIDYGASFVWIFPPDVMPGVARAYGIEIERADVQAPTIGLRPLDLLADPPPET